MGRKEKGRRYQVQVGFGAKITRQPSPGKLDYTYALACSACGWKSSERTGSIDPKKGQNDLMGHFDCESCGKANAFALREFQD